MSMRIEDEVEKSYDDFPYESFAIKQTHPYHLYTLAMLYGATPTSVEQAKVLELGCASGGNIIPMAFNLPHSRFYGIDLSRKQIEEGERQIQDLKLNNIRLSHQSILDFKAQDKFDYIICHGLFSWVEANIREKVLEICHDYLSPSGIAYISYNTFPGWKIGSTVRDMILLYTQNEIKPLEKTKKARTLLTHLASQLKDDTSYSALLCQEIDLLLKHSDTQLIHEHLGQTNYPLYFHQFMQQANHFNLHFLTEAFLTNMRTQNLPPEYEHTIENEENRILTGQYMDFVTNRRFRATLLSRQALIINQAHTQAAIEKCYLKLAISPLQDFYEKDIDAQTEVCFTNSTMSLKVKEPLFKLAMWLLGQIGDKPIHYSELFEKISQKNALLVDAQALDSFLFQAILGGMIDVSVKAPDYILDVTHTPLACPFARYQVYQQSIVTNRRHENIQLTSVAQALLPYLDGTRDKEELIEIISYFIQEGALEIVDEHNRSIEDVAAKRNQIEAICSKTLNLMAKQALLIG